MTEKRIAYLYQLASTLPQHENSHLLLKSYYMMKCLEITKGYGLPQKQFAPEKRCSHCHLEWINGNFQTKRKPIKLSKNQRRRIRKCIVQNKEAAKAKLELLHSIELERICSFCKHTTIIRIDKPKLEKTNNKKQEIGSKTSQNHEKSVLPIKKNVKIDQNKKEVNVYCQSKDVFSLQDNNNTIENSKKHTSKVINNNKRKKDKFAGLCKDAVLASAKIKKVQQNSRLSLFLKPST